MFFICHIFIPTAQTITIKRNTKICVQASRLQAERDKLSADKQDKMMGILEELQATVLRLSAKVDMTTKVDIQKYFPVTQDSDLQRFLDKSDGQFHLRREQFENFLYCSVTRTLKLKRPFETSLLATLFSRDFISSHRWPGPRYRYIYILTVFKPIL